MEEDCVGIEGPQRVLALEKKMKKSNNNKKVTMIICGVCGRRVRREMRTP
jgi:hypothetical protein